MTTQTRTRVQPSAPDRSPEPKRRSRSRSHQTWALPFLLPAAAFVLFVVIVPSARGIFYSFTDWVGFPEFKVTGLENYRRLIDDPLAHSAVWHTVALTFVTTVGVNVIGLLLAIGLNSNIRSKSLLRLVFFAPVIITPVVVASIWKFIYLPDGPLNSILAAVHLDQLQSAWLGDSSTALWAVMVTVIWQFSGISMVIYLAGLQGVPDDIIEAAHLDGAGAVRRLVSITLPQLTPSITVSVMLALIGGLKTFDQVWVMTEGGPGVSTQTLSTAQYQTTFVFGSFGYGSTFAVAISVLAVVAVLIQQAVLRRRGA